MSAKNFFKVDEDTTKLSLMQAIAFHNIVAKALRHPLLTYLVKQDRQDALLAIAFLTMQVREPNVENKFKLEQLVKYIRSTIDLLLILDANGTSILTWYVDASFVLHANMRGHTGSRLTMGRGFLIVSSTKQKLNTC